MNTSVLAKTYSRHRRLEILRALESDSRFTLNDEILQRALQLSGLAAPIATIHAELDWLRDAGLVTIETIGEIKTATLTQRGVDVAAGFTTVDGVARPRPRDE